MKQHHKFLYVGLIFYDLGIIVLSIDGLGSSIYKIKLSLDRVIFISTCLWYSCLQVILKNKLLVIILVLISSSTLNESAKSFVLFLV